jgi:hypothetical protein
MEQLKIKGGIDVLLVAMRVQNCAICDAMAQSKTPWHKFNGAL